MVRPRAGNTSGNGTRRRRPPPPAAAKCVAWQTPPPSDARRHDPRALRLPSSPAPLASSEKGQ